MQITKNTNTKFYLSDINVTESHSRPRHCQTAYRSKTNKPRATRALHQHYNDFGDHPWIRNRLVKRPLTGNVLDIYNNNFQTGRFPKVSAARFLRALHAFVAVSFSTSLPETVRDLTCHELSENLL